MMVYVILVSISYNLYQSTLAAVLASAAFLYSRGVDLLALNTFYAYADSVLAAMEFVFLGLMVSYTANTLREDARSARLDLQMLKEEYADLSAVNEENVLIKNEYEERLLTSKTGFPKLYSLISRLMVQEPGRILLETMEVVSELVRTDTVAVYQGQAGSPWLRLVGALNDSSTMGGKTWNLSGFPRVYEAVRRGELYQGELGSGEPAAVLPIVCRGAPAAVVLIKTLPYGAACPQGGDVVFNQDLFRQFSQAFPGYSVQGLAMETDGFPPETLDMPGADIRFVRGWLGGRDTRFAWEDGRTVFPAATRGNAMEDGNLFAASSVLGAYGMVSHVFDVSALVSGEEGAAWDSEKRQVGLFESEILGSTPWLEGRTLSQTGGDVKSYLEMEYGWAKSGSRIELQCSGAAKGQAFFYDTGGRIADAQGLSYPCPSS